MPLSMLSMTRCIGKTVVAEDMYWDQSISEQSSRRETKYLPHPRPARNGDECGEKED